MRLAADHVAVTVPATAGNLGPGFDSLGMALGLADQLEVRAVASSETLIEVEGEGANDVPRDESHLVVRALRHALDYVGASQVGLHITARNNIPHGRGLGSSAAAAVAGITAARGLIAEPEALSDDVVLQLATHFEGHPDNAAPAIYGGATVAWSQGEAVFARPLNLSDSLQAAVLIPQEVLPTKEARAALPTQVPHVDAAFNLSRSALLVHALAGSLDDLFIATEDRLHQNYRAPIMPTAHAFLTELREYGFAAIVSGAGPSILVLGENLEQALAQAAIPGLESGAWRTVVSANRVPGATVRVIPS